MLLSIVIAVVALFVLVLFLYNRLVSARNQVAAAWSDIDVQLNRRHTLIPELVETVKAYRDFERQTQTLAASIRSASLSGNPAELAAQEASLNHDLRQILLLKEDYPELKADAHFLELMENLAATEDKLQYARRYYNGSVRVYNTHIQQFPDNLVARPFGFHEAEFFELESIEQAAPSQVKL